LLVLPARAAAVKRGSGLALTYEDYRLLPDDGRRWELIGGDFHVSPSPTSQHQQVVAHLVFHLIGALWNRRRAQVLASPIDVILDETNTVQPDVLVVKREHESIITRRGIVGVPDLVIEVVSPHKASMDLVLKRHLYERFGVPEYWLIDPDERTVTVLVKSGKGFVETLALRASGQIRSKVFPTLKLPVARVFAAVS
jgi:Uma2 family endonuclease